MSLRSIGFAILAWLLLASIPALADLTYTTINDPSGTNGTFAYGINTSGAVTGTYYDASDIQHGFVYNNGTYTTLNDPSAFNGTYATGINASGAVTGYYYDASDVVQSFIATPSVVPEPASLAMLGMGTLMATGYGALRSARSRGRAASALA